MNLLGIDFEEWYHPKLIRPHLSNKKKNPMVINSIDKIIDWLRKNDTLATFFVVGELLEYKPDLLDKIIDNGHEIGFHTMHHTELNYLDKEKFEEEVLLFNKLTSGKSKGFRAPTFSLNSSTSWAIDVLEKNGYTYDSSIIPTKSVMYGVSNCELNPYHIQSKNITKNSQDAKIIEFPLLTTKFFGKRIPAAGGFYIRALPLKIIENAIKNYEKSNMPAATYIHSWELAPEFLPDIPLPFKEKFITFYNIKKAFSRMDKLIKKFEFTSFSNHISKLN